MKIKVVHDACGREVLVQQILQFGGHCPWDGRPFSAHYTGILTEQLQAAEEAGSALESALDKIAGMEAHMTLDEESLIGPLSDQLDRLNRRKSRRFG